MSAPLQTVIAVRSEVRGPLLALLGFWFVAALVVAMFADSVWLLAIAAGGITTSVAMLFVALRPRTGDLVRLVLDRPRCTLYWAHHGSEPEEIPFASLRAVAIEPSPDSRYVHLWAVDLSGRWVSLGRDLRSESEPFAQEVAEAVGIPVWYRETVVPPHEEKAVDIDFKMDVSKPEH